MGIFDLQFPKCIIMNVLSVDTVRTDHHTGETHCTRCFKDVYDGSKCCQGMIRWSRYPHTDDLFIADLTEKGQQEKQRQYERSWLNTEWGR